MDHLQHVGVKRRSGRYPWGSGDDPYQSKDSFFYYVNHLRDNGLSDKEIYDGLGISSTVFRARYASARNEKRASDIAFAVKLKEKGLSNTAIGERLGVGESQVRSLLDPAKQARVDSLTKTTDALKENLERVPYIDVGPASELYMGISDQKFKTALAALKDEGYNVYYLKVPQPAKADAYTTVKVLAKPDIDYKTVVANRDQLGTLATFSEDGGATFKHIQPPVSVSSKRVDIKYAEDGGAKMDGVIELRRGVDDIALGNSRYAQVRIAVDDTHYLKGMAIYADDLPKGVDIRFNTNKSDSGNKLDALKGLKDDDDRPFGAVIKKQHYFLGKDGKERQSAINIVNEEGDWDSWSNTLSSQMLSKQSLSLAKRQLGIALQKKQAEYDEIMALTNPTIKKKLIEAYSDSCDADAVHLKAASLPRQRTQVILPISSLKDNEIYAPNFNNGESVVLIRHPHAGRFEIPELVVNNKNPKAKSIIGQGVDAVGINHKVAERLSGADFDGDSVLVIPNNEGRIKNAPALAALKNFDPKIAYRPYDGMRTMDGGTWSDAKKKIVYAEGTRPNSKTKQREMGNISNLITDMTVKNAGYDEIARAARHSMTVIDAEKHALDYKLSYTDNRIAELKEKYQGRAERGNLKGASTLISRASSEQRVDQRRIRKASEGGAIDPVTGKKVYVKTGATYVDKRGKVIIRDEKSKKMLETDDAYSLSSGTSMESIYADHANQLKSLGNTSRKDFLNTPALKYSPAAAKTYTPQVESLQAKLNVALKNKPLERKAQLIADTIIEAKRKENPDMVYDELKKIKGQAIVTARARVGANKIRVQIEPEEWAAIQAGAISDTKLRSIIENADLDHIKMLATPRAATKLSGGDLSRAKSMLSNGRTQAEIATALGVSASTINDLLKEG